MPYSKKHGLRRLQRHHIQVGVFFRSEDETIEDDDCQLEFDFLAIDSRLKIKYTIGNENFSILGAASLCFDSR